LQVPERIINSSFSFFIPARVLANDLTQKYYNSFEKNGCITWMQARFDPAGTPASFRAVN